MIHVTPVGDLMQHAGDDCICGPDIEYVDPRTGETYPDGDVLVIHHSLDGRELEETP